MMMTGMRFFDAHTHVNFAAFKDDYAATVARAREAGVVMVAVGTQKDTSLRAVEIAREFPGSVYAAVGIHPIHADRSHHDADELGSPSTSSGFTSRGEEFDFEYYKKLALDPKVVAIGECGLDYYRMMTNDNNDDRKRKQKEIFEQHIRLAHEVKKPLMIHCREAYGDLTDILGAHSSELFPGRAGVAHFFSGTKNDVKKLLDLGFYFTFGGVVTFTRDYDEVVKYIPIDSILSETDAPYVTPAPYRGNPSTGLRASRNEPAYVIEVVNKLAELKDVSVEEMRSCIWANAWRVFRLQEVG